MEKYIKEKMLVKNKKYILAYQRGMLILLRADNKEFVKKKRIYTGLRANVLIERLLRYEPRAAVSLNNNTFLYSAHGGIYEYDCSNNSITLKHRFPKDMNNPLSFCERRDGSGKLIEVVYGEYKWNKNKEAVTIYKYDLRKWSKAYTFPPNSILHIHNVVYDDIRNRYIILTGDSNEESAIYESDIEFKNVKKIVGGDQKYRACVVYPVENGIFYATDTPLEQNYVFFLSNEGELKIIYQMPGPCIFGRVYNDSLYMATSVEGDPSLGGWRYRLSNKLGKGVRDRKVHIIKCSKKGDVSEVMNLKKDFLPMWLFQFGNAQFPFAKDGVYISTQSTVEKGTYKIDACIMR